MSDFIKAWLVTTAVVLGFVLFVMLLSWTMTMTISVALAVVVFAIGFGGVVAFVTEYL